MGNFLSSEDVARNDEVEATYLTKTAADSDFVRQVPFNTGIQSVRGDYEAAIRALRGGYEKSLSELKGEIEGDYTGQFTALKGTYPGSMESMYNDYTGKFNAVRGGYDKSMKQMVDDYNGQFETLQTTLTNNYTAADTALSNDYNGKFTTLRGTYEGNLSGLKSDIEGDYEAQITALGTALRNEYTTGNTALSADYDGKFNTLRGDYDRNKNLKNLDDDLRAYTQAQINSLRGANFNDTLTDLKSQSNSQYATLDNLFKEFRDNTYTPDKAAIITRANEIEALINSKAIEINNNTDERIRTFQNSYDSKLNEKVSNSRFNEIANTSLTGLTPNDITRIKTIINSNNFTTLYNDLKTRGVITEVPATQDTNTPTITTPQFLRHLRNRNYIIY